MDIILLKKEDCGMQLDSNFYSEMVLDFRKAFQIIFADEVVLKKEFLNFEHMGNFKLIYEYIPQKYNIIVENELRTFTITIEDDEKATNSLYRIEKFDNQLEKKNVIHSLEILKNVLVNNTFNFYIKKDNKLYRKNANGLKRVKDIKELLNG